ncbi:MAG: hypothetical protein ACKOHG_20825 [Planctomycetia bacterium]
MIQSMFRDRSPARLPLAGSVGMFIGCGLLAAGMTGCSQSSPPPVAVKPAAARAAHAAHHDHDHDHGKHDDHDHDHDDDHGHGGHGHAHPETLAAGVAELEATWKHVKTALGAGDRDAADEKVHEVGHLLEDFEGLLLKQTADVQEAGKKAVEEVFACFDTLDTALHGDEDDLKKVDLDKLGDRLEAAVKTLKGLAK